MSEGIEVRLPAPVKAQAVTLKEGQHDLFDSGEPGKVAGAFHYDGIYFQYRCPCGCHNVFTIPAIVGPKQSSAWEFNGDLSNPTLSPSVHIIGHWHGWLRDGNWVQA